MMISYAEANKETLEFIFENKRRRENGLPIIELNHCPGCADTGWDSEFDEETEGPEPESCAMCKHNYPGKEETKNWRV
jgi:hypothetical protein